VRGDGQRTRSGVGIIVASIFCGVFGIGFWTGLLSAV